eukprot:2964567-Prymnesium_polylepis.1
MGRVGGGACLLLLLPRAVAYTSAVAGTSVPKHASMVQPRPICMVTDQSAAELQACAGLDLRNLAIAQMKALRHKRQAKGKQMISAPPAAPAVMPSVPAVADAAPTVVKGNWDRAHRIEPSQTGQAFGWANLRDQVKDERPTVVEPTAKLAQTVAPSQAGQAFGWAHLRDQ